MVDTAHPARPVRSRRRSQASRLLLAFAAALLTIASAPTGSREGALLHDFDLRLHAPSRIAPLLDARIPKSRLRAAGAPARSAELSRAVAALRARHPDLEVTVSPLTGSAELVAVPGRALTEPAPEARALDIALSFLRSQADLYGLSPSRLDDLGYRGESRSPSGLRMVVLEQTVERVPVFQGRLRVLLDAEGRVVRSVGRLVPGLSPETVVLPDPDLDLSAAQARAAALAGVGRRVTSATRDVYRNQAASWSVLFPLGPGVAVSARAQILHLPEASVLLVVDARNGELLWRSRLSHSVVAPTQEARFSVYVQGDGVTPAESPAPGNPNWLLPGSGYQFPPIARTTVTMSRVQDLSASPEGWIPDGGVTTTGNNVDAYLDTDADDRPDADLLDLAGRPRGNPDAQGRERDFLGSVPRDFSYTPPPSGTDPGRGDRPADAAVRRGALVQAFYITNWFHDWAYRKGFDEPAGNFQSYNFGRGGVGGDPFLIETQDGEGLGDARIDVAPDGAPGRVHIRLYATRGTHRDGALDAYLVLHELVHGLTLRVVNNAIGLYYSPLGALSEGWSDFYALALLAGGAGGGHDPDGQYAAGGWLTYSDSLPASYLYGVRRFPYTTDNGVNPLTWADTDETTLDLSGGIPASPWDQSRRGAAEVHNAGEVWASSLWEVRSRIVAAHGGDVAAGNEVTLQIVTDALKATPPAPTFLQARDALLDVDCATHRCAHEEQIWAGFADRGLGWGAYVSPTSTTAHYGVREAFARPHLDVARVTVEDAAEGNGNGFADPGEIVELTVELFNPWRGRRFGVPGATARLRGVSPGIEVLDGEAAWGPLAARARVAAEDTFRVRLPAEVCGRRLKLALDIESPQGAVTVPFDLRLGRPVGTGAPRVYPRHVPGGLPIPDARGAGVVDTLWIDDDLEVADLDLRIDELRHPRVGDLAIALRGPEGYGFDVVYLPADRCPEDGEYDYGCNRGRDLVGTVFDDEAGPGRDLLVVGAAAAPFSGRWIPFGNSPALVVRGRLLSDPVAQFARFDGTGTRGAWKLHAVDYAADLEGALLGWSLVVTPRRFLCREVAWRPGTLGFAEEALIASEGDGMVLATVQRTGGRDGVVSVRYETESLTATGGEDYRPVSGTLTWADGDSQPKTVAVRLTGDTVAEPSEMLRLVLDQPSGDAVLAAGGREGEVGLFPTAAVVVRDDDRPAGCGNVLETPAPELCLLDGRFRVEVIWRDPRTDDVGAGGAIPSSDKTGFFWFFDPGNVELIVKMLDGRSLTGAFWHFYGALSDVEYWVVVTDTRTEAVRVYRNPPYEICGRADTAAFPGGVQALPAFGIARQTDRARALSMRSAEGVGACDADGETLCLLDGRFRLQVAWHDPRSGDRGTGRAIPHTEVGASLATGSTGFFWFFAPDNVELVVKVLDATAFSGRFWVFYGALTDVEYTLSVTDTVTGARHDYHNPAYQLCGGADTDTFQGS